MDRQRVRDWLVAQVAVATGLPREAIEVASAFSGYGLDSVRLSEIAAGLEAVVGRAVDPLVMFECRTIAELVEHLAGTRAVTGSPVHDQAVPRHEAERIAVVGMACRMPGASDLDAFWRVLEDGVVAVSEVPASRWDADRLYAADPNLPGRVASKWGGFLDSVEEFDAKFFRIPPEEALHIDPQQRLLLETCWDALEDAGNVPARLRGSHTGVYVGISTNEYGNRQLGDRMAIGPYTSTGNALSMAANRLSYVFDLVGPSVAVDTACSSSLVAAHLAMRAIRGRECDAAVVAGVNLLLDPELTMALGKPGMLSPDGLCKPFDARANGYVRGEGCAVVVLESLEVALERGARIYAVLLGSAVNQDGASNGLTAPNPAAQRGVLRAAYRDAGVEPSAVEYVECHGTGTFLGDPIEARSLGAVVGPGRPGATPCVIGSVKSNVGHLEAAAGMAGLIKTALALHRDAIPPSVNFVEPNPHIPFEALGLCVATESLQWREPRDRRLAGVSSFGFGGTNAHVVMASGPLPPPGRGEGGPVVLALSARTRPGLGRLARAWVDRLGTAGREEVVALAYNAAVRRTHHRPFRLAVVADDAGALASRVADAVAGPATRSARSAGPAGGAPRVAFVFSGQGSTWPGMGRMLLATNPLFRSSIRRSDEVLGETLGWSVEAALRGEDGRDVEDTAVAQPLLVAAQLALARVWRAIGIEPVAVVGHSIGEVSAAIVAGLLDEETGLTLAARRGRLMSAPGGEGRMLAVGLAREEAEREVGPAGGALALAAVNGPRATVLAGDAAGLDRIRTELVRGGVFAQWLPIPYAFHGRRMQGAADALLAELGDLVCAAGDVPFYSSVLGRRPEVGEVDARYWARNVRDTVEFAAAIGALLADGVDAVLEVGMHPVLRTPLRQLARSAGAPDIAVLHSLERGRDDRRSLLDAVARLYEMGCPVRWKHLFPEQQPVASLPGYPWERERYWIERHDSQAGSAPRAGEDPLIGSRIDLAGSGVAVWETVLSLDAIPGLRHHRVGGSTVLPASAYVHIARRAGAAAGVGPISVRELTMHRPLALDEHTVVVQTTLVADGDGHTVHVHAKPDRMAAPSEWTLHATARIVAAGIDEPPPVDLLAAELRCLDQLSGPLFYRLLAGEGLDYGPVFRGVREAWRTEGEAIATIAIEEDEAWPGSSDVRALDSAFQLVAAAVGLGNEGPSKRLPVPAGVESVRWWMPARSAERARVVVQAVDSNRIRSDVALLAGDGRVCVDVRGLELRRPPIERTSPPADEPSLWLYEPRWRERPLQASRVGAAAPAHHPSRSKTAPAGPWLVILDRSGVGRRLLDELARLGIPAVGCVPDGSLGPAPAETLFDPRDPSHYQRLIDQLAPPGKPLGGVVHLLCLDESVPARGGGLDAGVALLPAASVLHVVRALAFAPGRGSRLIVATPGCQPVDPDGSDVVAPLSATAWGLLKAVPIENPILTVTCVDVSLTDGDPVPHLLAEMAATSPDIEVAYRRGRRLVRRLVQVGTVCALRRQEGQDVLSLSAEGTYVISGGTGGLGLQVAGRLVERGARRVALLARSDDRTGLTQEVETLRRDGADVRIVPCDVRDRAHVSAALDAVRSWGPPIRGVVHAAGVLDDRALLDLSPESLQAVLVPKVVGGWNLSELTVSDPLDWFVLFSSAAGVLGSPGQAAYSAANAYLDALAHHRRRRGLPARTIDWGPWAGPGMGGRVENSEGRRLRTAISAIDTREGLAMFERLVVEPRTQTVVLPFDLRDLIQFYPTPIGLSFFEEITTREERLLKSIGAESSARPDISVEYVAPRNDIERRIVGIWQKALDIEPVGVLESFFDLGGDSVFGNQILLEINRLLDVSIRPEQAFEDFTVAGLAKLAEQETIVRLEGMSDDETERLLRSLTSGDGGDDL